MPREPSRATAFVLNGKIERLQLTGHGECAAPPTMGTISSPMLMITVNRLRQPSRLKNLMELSSFMEFSESDQDLLIICYHGRLDKLYEDAADADAMYMLSYHDWLIETEEGVLTVSMKRIRFLLRTLRSTLRTNLPR